MDGSYPPPPPSRYCWSCGVLGRDTVVARLWFMQCPREAAVPCQADAANASLIAARRPAAGALIWRQANQSSNNRTFVRTT